MVSLCGSLFMAGFVISVQILPCDCFIAHSTTQSQSQWRTSGTVERPFSRYESQRSVLTTPSSSSASSTVGPRLDINEQYPGLKQVYSNPDIFVIQDFLTRSACENLVQAAQEKKLERSPVAYAGWTQDVKDLVELAAKGPVAWLALLMAWFQVKDAAGEGGASQMDLVVHSLQNYVVVLLLATLSIAAFTWSRAQGLKELRTSTSTTLDHLGGDDNGAREFVERTARLFQGGGGNPNNNLAQEAALFEAPTVIRYEADQVLAPHFDANPEAATEDANRGGQTLATLLVYLNPVERGGRTRFGKLSSGRALDPSLIVSDEALLTIPPRRGDALLFFPADAAGRFDDRTEHEGCRAQDEKWIARIWRHENRVPPPFGLDEAALREL